MAIAPRALVVTRPTEYDELLGRHGTRAAVGFFLSQRGRSLDEVDERHGLQQRALKVVSDAIPVDWRRASVSRRDLDRWVFGPEDIIIAVGQDGLVANVAKYLDGQVVVGVNPDPVRNPGVLVTHDAAELKKLLPGLAGGGAVGVEVRAMVEVQTDDGQSLRALNEIFIGDAGHQSARYEITVGGVSEHQSSSGVLVGSGTGSTGWCKSVWAERELGWSLPSAGSKELAWFVREAWPSAWTGCEATAGVLKPGSTITIRCESDSLVAFGDGIEADHLDLRWGQSATISVSAQTLRLA